MSLKFRQTELVENLDQSLADVKDLANESNLFVERVEPKGGLVRPWTLKIKTLTGRVIDVVVSSPQVSGN